MADSINSIQGPHAFQVIPEDRALFSQYLSGFMPPNSFDAHVHLYRCELLKGGGPKLLYQGPPVLGWNAYTEGVSSWMGNSRPDDGLVFAFPVKDMDLKQSNHFVVDEITGRAGSRALRMIQPGENPSDVESDVEKHGFAGFKVYHLFADRGDTFNSTIGEYLPEWAWEIANRRGLAIMLHIVRERSLADPANHNYLRTHCSLYRSAKVILAHAARGFCARHTIEGIENLRGLDNVYFDTSGICESGALEAILRTFGPTRLWFGSDSPISSSRGRCVSVGDQFFWMNETNPDWKLSPTPVGHTLVGLESLLALKQACQTLHLRDKDVEQIFGEAARTVMGLKATSGGSIGQECYRVAKKIIPGGTQLLSKRPEMFAPGQWPPYFAEARGVEVIDIDGRHFIDMTTGGIGACLLGYSDPEVNSALLRRVTLGSACTLNPPEEIELAKLLLELHPWAQNVRFGRAGGEAMALAVRIARARTKRDVVAFCGYHGWQDWYLAANLSPEPGKDPLSQHLLSGLEPAGVPSTLAGTALPFTYNRLDELAAIVEGQGERLAAIVLETTRTCSPEPGFLQGVTELAKRSGAVSIFDEITCGWRLHKGGAHLRYGVDPDVCVFGKALGNGVPIAAIIGTEDVMQAAQKSFISSTMWTEGLGPTAALATVRKMMREDVPSHTADIGVHFREGLARLARQYGIPLKLSGHPALTFLEFAHPEKLAIQTLLTVRMLNRGFLCGSAFYPTLAHQHRHVDEFLDSADGVFLEIEQAMKVGDLQKRVGGPLRRVGFSRIA
jgi:glutamate-1-semialdehyde 2,1-aminomutase